MKGRVVHRSCSEHGLWITLLLAATPCSAATPLVTGNGYGFAVVSPSSGIVTTLLAHPHSFTRPDPKQPLGEGVPTTDFLDALEWGAPRAADRVAYLDQSHVIAADRGDERATYWMPFGLERHALIAAWTSASGGAPPCLSPRWSQPARVGAGERAASSGGAPRRLPADAFVVSFASAAERLVVAALDGSPSYEGGCFGGASAWALLSLEPGESAPTALEELRRWRGELAPAGLLERELRGFEAWRSTPAATFLSEPERALWRQSETVLRLGQSREPNREARAGLPARRGHGLIVAALPDGSWSMPWARDMAYAAGALSRMGHAEEARWALQAYFDARPVGRMRREAGGLPYQVSVARYFGDGAEEPYFPMEGAANVELDDWGLVLWTLGEHVQRHGDWPLLDRPTYRGALYQSAKRHVAEPLLANLETRGDGAIVKPDTSIWEERQKDKKHFLFSTAAALAGLRAFQPLAERRGDARFAARLRREAARLERGLRASFVRDGALLGTAEANRKNEIDGAALAAIGLDVAPDTAAIRGTVERMPALQMPSGGYRRVRSDYEDRRIYEYWYERQEFVFTDLSMAEAQLRLGEPERAAPLLRRVVEQAARDSYFVPEMYVSLPCALFPGRLGDPTGAIPMVGYGAGAYVVHLLQRERFSDQKH